MSDQNENLTIGDLIFALNELLANGYSKDTRIIDAETKYFIEKDQIIDMRKIAELKIDLKDKEDKRATILMDARGQTYLDTVDYTRHRYRL